jgi:anti-sigma factor RsiW
MRLTPDHITERELVLATNGELPPARFAAVRRHLDSCSECRARLSSFEAALGEYFDAYHEDLDPQQPDRTAARQRLAQRLEDLSGGREPWRGWSPQFTPVTAALAAGAIAAGLACLAFVRQFTAEPTRFAPDSALTPGLTRPVTTAQLCARDTDEPAPSVSRAVAMEVFQRHGIANPAPGAYELDYLIPPELGGARDNRNLWPQPYQEAPWNAHAKDALEERLRWLVCDGKLELQVAQKEIANNWTVAYRKYFETNEPLLSHARFLKDTPWQ